MGDFSHFRDLVRRAREAESDVDVVEDELGNAMRIERDPDAPAAFRLDPIGFGGDPIFEAVWELPAAASPPSVHPAEVPFLAGLHASVVKDDAQLMASWTEAGPFKPDAEALARLEREMPADIREMVSSLGAAMEDRAATTEQMKELRDRLADESLEPWPKHTAEIEPSARMNDAFESLCEEMLREGWIRSGDALEPGAAVFRSASFASGDRVRKVVLSGVGVAQIRLIEMSADA